MICKVLIVDDHPVVREGLVARLAQEPDIVVCGEAANVAEALSQMDSILPDVVVVDIQLGPGNGLDLIQRIKARASEASVLVWSMFSDTVYAQRALRAGALGYLNKRHATTHIVKAIRTVHAGQVFLHEEQADALLDGEAPLSNPVLPQPFERSHVELLSDRELEVFRSLGQGFGTAEIAARLHRSLHTIESHRQRIKDKLGLTTAGELTRAAVQWTLENG